MNSNQTVFDLLNRDELFIKNQEDDKNNPIFPQYQLLLVIHKHTIRNINRIRKSFVGKYTPEPLPVKKAA